ncbi:MAG: Nicotinate-nucleotide adenylyltransferase [Chlamydiia bacterium]|nr:Nicotinate-nucleotide adenylyltransferase [Chlamydiia bacterium]
MDNDVEKIGVCIGTFDPPTYGHLAMIEGAKEAFQLDTVLMCPTPFPLNKQQTPPVANLKQRVEMCELLIPNESGYEVYTERDSGKVSFTINLIRELKKGYKGELYLILGAEHLPGFGAWVESKEIEKLTKIVVATRKGGSVEEVIPHLPETVGKERIFEVEPLDISSTEVRTRLKEGQEISELVPPKIVDYIRKHHLYS